MTIPLHIEGVTILKFQFNNVSALIGGYDKLIENINTSLNSKGWAESQAEYQMDSITRQIAALKAEAMELINILNQAGATGAVKDMVSGMTTIVEVLQKIRPETLATTGKFIEWFFVIKSGMLIIRGLIPMLTGLGGTFSMLLEKVMLLTAGLKVFDETMTRTQKITSFATGLLKVTNAIGIVITALSLLSMASDMLSNKEKEREQQEEKALDSAKERAASSQTTLENMQQSGKQLERLKDSLAKYTAQANNESESEAVRVKAKEKMAKTQEAMITLLGKEAGARLEAAGWTEDAVNREIKAFNAKIEAQNQVAINDKKNQLEQTVNDIEKTKLRIEAIKSEIVALQELAKAHAKPLDASMQITEMYGGFSEELQPKQDEPLFSDDPKKSQKEVERLEKEAKDLESSKSKIESELANLQTFSITKTMGEDDDSSKSGSGGSGNYAEQLTRNVLLAKKNQLMYDAKTAMTEYDTALKKLNNDEEINGKTYENQIAKIKLFDNRINELDGTKDKYKQFLSDLQAELDAKIADSPDLMELTGYDPNAADDVKQKCIEINKETFQQVKTLSTIYNLMDNIKSKMAEIDNQQESINKNKNSMYIKTDSGSVYEQMLKEKSASYNRIVNAMYSPTNYDYDNQKIKAELNYRYDLEKQYADRVKALGDDLLKAKDAQNLELYQKTKNELDQLYLTQSENANKIKDLEYDKVKVIKEGLSEVAVDFLVQGNSLKDIWKNLWKDLAREAIQRMLQIKAQASVLGSLFGIFGGSGGGTIGSGMTEGMTVAGGTYTLSHGGEDISGYPKMHDGGAVNYGRVGVVPKLKNDEVVRTLQVGEEVNSIKDRRSNELMAGLIMKQMEESAKQPTMVNINALDSKSFAEYLNENSDILAAILAKNKAMNR